MYISTDKARLIDLYMEKAQEYYNDRLGRDTLSFFFNDIDEVMEAEVLMEKFGINCSTFTYNNESPLNPSDKKHELRIIGDKDKIEDVIGNVE